MFGIQLYIINSQSTWLVKNRSKVDFPVRGASFQVLCFVCWRLMADFC